uniref:Uncharacterized protein n=1 Tax=Raphanus sativus TaxID=3726 RepID=A0A650GBN3_RAPSA|nr:hypothetical protein [Raphanus sativus]QGW48575.1 hypothetical protein [Raphanus sativus]
MEHISRLTDPLEGRIHPIDRRLKDSYSFFTIADQVLGINCSEKPLLAKKQEFRCGSNTICLLVKSKKRNMNLV